MTEQCVANQCKLIFSEYGWPETLISDNGPCIYCRSFYQYNECIHVNHITNTPHYPQSNGLTKNYVHIVKNFLQGKRRGERSIQMLDDLLQYTILVAACSH